MIYSAAIHAALVCIGTGEPEIAVNDPLPPIENSAISPEPLSATWRTSPDWSMATKAGEVPVANGEPWICDKLPDRQNRDIVAALICHKKNFPLASTARAPGALPTWEEAFPGERVETLARKTRTAV